MINHNLDQEEIINLQRLLLNWFEENRRVFPWRESRNPFHILIAEKLLQQTLVGERIVTAYLEIIRRYPDPLSLSSAQEDDVLPIVAPLGLNYRAQELIQLATAVEVKFQGKLPKEYDKLIGIPGIGEYTARAILSFAYEEDVAIVDTNVARFLFRVFAIDLPMPANPARKKLLANLAKSILPEGKSRDFNLAILDLCAAICKSQNPICIKCPIREICYTGSNNK